MEVFRKSFRLSLLEPTFALLAWLYLIKCVTFACSYLYLSIGLDYSFSLKDNNTMTLRDNKARKYNKTIAKARERERRTPNHVTCALSVPAIYLFLFPSNTFNLFHLQVTPFSPRMIQITPLESQS